MNLRAGLCTLCVVATLAMHLGCGGAEPRTATAPSRDRIVGTWRITREIANVGRMDFYYVLDEGGSMDAVSGLTTHQDGKTRCRRMRARWLYASGILTFDGSAGPALATSFSVDFPDSATMRLVPRQGDTVVLYRAVEPPALAACDRT